MKLTAKQKVGMRVFSALSKTRFFLAYGGARSGKTVMICRAIIIRACKYSKTMHCILRQSKTSCISTVWKQTLIPLLETMMPEGGWTETTPVGLPTIIKFANGSEIWSGGFDNKQHADAILGQEWQTVFLNEATDSNYRTFKKLKTRLNKQKGSAIPLKFVLDCNPTTPSHWIARYFVEGVDDDTQERIDKDERALCEWMHFTPQDNADNIDGTTLKTLERLTGMERKRFWEGIWADNFVGQVYYAFNRSRNIPDQPPVHNPLYEQWTTWDFGIRDHAVVLFMQVRKVPTDSTNELGAVIEIYDEYINNEQPPSHYGQICNERYNMSMFRSTGDPAGGSRHEGLKSWVDQLRQHNINIQYDGLSGTTISEYISNANRIIPYINVHPKTCPNTVKALENWSYVLDKDGKVPQGAKPAHDELSHVGTALYYFFMYRFRPDKQVFKPFSV